MYTITGDLRSKIDGIWNVFYSGGMSNPLDVIEQWTYLQFIHDYSAKATADKISAQMIGKDYVDEFTGTFTVRERNFDRNDFRWSTFKEFPAEKMFDVVANGVFPFLKQLHPDRNSAYALYMNDAIFKIPTPEKLVQIVDRMDEVYATIDASDNHDLRGDLYEYLLSKLSTSGTNGQFRTPRHIIRMMVDLTAPTMDDTVCDPAFGTAGFLVAVSEYLREHHEEDFLNPQKMAHYNNEMFTGFDMDRTMLRIGAMNMIMHDVRNPNIQYMDSLSGKNTLSNQFSLVLANPPFKGSLDASTVSPDLLQVANTKKTELLFVALFLRLLRAGGRAAVIVPDGVVFGSDKAHVAIRKELVEKQQLQAVISMPSGIFKPYAGVSTSILFFTKTGNGGTEDVWFYDMKADGFSLDDNRSPIAENDIPDIEARFKNLAVEKGRARTEQSFLVPKDEIVANNYDLSVNKYRAVVHEEVTYPPTKELLADIRRLDAELNDSLDELEKMLKDD